MPVDDGFRPPPDHVVSDTHTSLYRMVGFWGRKPHNLVHEYITHYSDEGDTVLDPFSGSGVTAFESLRAGRRGIYNDLNPLFTFLAASSAEYVDLQELEDAYDEVRRSLRCKEQPLERGDEIVTKPFCWLYSTRCRNCGHESARIIDTEATCVYAPSDETPTESITGDGTLDKIATAVYEILQEHGRVSHSELLESIDLDRFGNARKGEVTRAINERLFDKNYVTIERDHPVEIRYTCEECDITEEVDLADDDHEKLAEISELEPTYYYPDHELQYPNGEKFYTYRPGTESVDRLFTERNLIALAILRHEITQLASKGYDEACVNALKVAFVGMLEQVSRMQRPNKKGWAAKNYIIHPENLEMNVAYTFENRFRTVLDGMSEANEELNNGSPLGDRGRFIQGDARDLPVGDGEVDYVFTDPEYGDAVQYFELSYMWSSWLDTETNWEDEIVVNPRQDKGRNQYERMLTEAFSEVFRVMAVGGHMTVTFHSREIQYWNSLIFAIQEAGFDYVDAVYQVPHSEYTNWMYRQRPGTMNGDIYITFHRPETRTRRDLSFDEVHEAKEAIVDEAREIIKLHDGEATFDQLVRGVTIRLIDEGAMHSEQVRDFDYEQIFDDHFQRVGQESVWTIEKWEEIDDLDYVPVRRRIHWLIESVFANADGETATLEEILSTVFTSLKDSQTPENQEIRDVLETLAYTTEEDGETVWHRRNNLQATLGNYSGDNHEVTEFKEEQEGKIELDEEEHQQDLDHDRVLKQIADLGGTLGFDVWTGEVETRRSKALRQATTLQQVPDTVDSALRERMEKVDVIWFDGTEPVAMFEVEHPTKPEDGMIRMAKVFSDSEHTPLAVTVLPDSERTKDRSTVDKLAEIETIENRPFYRITYSELMEYLDSQSTATTIDGVIAASTRIQKDDGETGDCSSGSK